MPSVKIVIKKCINTDQPGWVECELKDCHGTVHIFHEKIPIVTGETIWSNSHYPCCGDIRCEIIVENIDNAVVKISTDSPDGVVSINGVSVFEVMKSEIINCS